MSFSPTNLLIKPVYGVNDYGEDKIIPLGLDQLTLQSLTITAIDQILRNDNDEIEDIPVITTDSDTMAIAHEGDDTAFDRIYTWRPDMTAWVYKTAFVMAVALRVSAYTTGSFRIDSITINATEELPDGTENQKIVQNLVIAPSTAFTALTATGEQMFIILADWNTPYKVTKGNPIQIQIAINETTGTGTRQVGIMPLFPFQQTNIANYPKIHTISHVGFHIHASLDHAFPVFRDQSTEDKLDYAGTTITKLKQ